MIGWHSPAPRYHGGGGGGGLGDGGGKLVRPWSLSVLGGGSGGGGGEGAAKYQQRTSALTHAHDKQGTSVVVMVRGRKNTEPHVPPGHTWCSRLDGKTKTRCCVVFANEESKGRLLKMCPKHRSVSRRQHSKQLTEVQSIEVPSGYVQCSKVDGNWRCKEVFQIEERNGKQIKMCPKHRASGRANHANFTAQPSKKAWLQTWHKEYKKTDAGHSVLLKAKRKYRSSEHGKRTMSQQKKQPLSIIRNRIYQLLRDKNCESATVSRYTSLQSNSQLRQHLEHTMESWMNWGNHGKHIARAPYKTAWQLGHRIPCSEYDPCDPDDIRRCHSTTNIYCQDARENVELGNKLPAPSAMDTLRSVWPKKYRNNPPPGCSVTPGLLQKQTSIKHFFAQPSPLASASFDMSSSECSSDDEDSD